MALPTDAPKTPKLLFLVSDALLIATAIVIAVRAGTPLPPAASSAISACVFAGALLLVLPFLLDYNRRQEALLAERQEALEALVRTTAGTVEQASIAASGLHEIAELAQKNLRAAEQLPQKLHERINEFSRTQDDAMAAELEALQQEVNTLRGSEAEKLESAADKIHRTAVELAKVEGTLRQHLDALDQAAQRAAKTVEAATAHALKDLEHQAERWREKLAAPLPAPAAPATRVPAASSSAPTPSRPAPATPAPAVDSAPPPVVEPKPSAPATSAAPTVTPASHPAAPATRKATARRTADASAPALFADDVHADASESGAPSPATPPTSAASPRPSPQPADEAVQLAPDEALSEAARSSDGATRLVVTAYIGIGNKLFVRGHGPGLSWDRGVPLQFVSIGKWRWESADATEPVTIKLFKNDQTECATVGEIQLNPGHQREVTATF